MSKWFRILAASLLLGIAVLGGVAHAQYGITDQIGSAQSQNQTPTTSPILGGGALPYKLSLRLVGPLTSVPTLQSFASANYAGLWVMIGGRLNGLHQFTSDPLKNFPPSEQNRTVYVIDPARWQVWSRPLSDSKLTSDQVDELSAVAYEHVQANDVLYIVGGYGYTRSTAQFQTYPMLTAIGIPQLIDWVRNPSGSPDLATLIRQTSSETLRVTGGQMTIIGGRALLIFGQDFEGGYGNPAQAVQTYTGQVRSFRIADTGTMVSIQDIQADPQTPDYVNFRRRDYTLALAIDGVGATQSTTAVALSGVFTLTNGIFTVPVEVGRAGHPVQADPTASTTFKQGMNSYNSASLGLYSASFQQTHTILFGSITYVYFDAKSGEFVSDSSLPFTNQISAIVRNADRQYQQYLLGARFPTIIGPTGTPLRFGAEATFFLKPGTPTMTNGLVDLDALLARAGGQHTVIGWIFGGIAAPGGSPAETFASNEVFEVVLQTQDSTE